MMWLGLRFRAVRDELNGEEAALKADLLTFSKTDSR